MSVFTSVILEILKVLGVDITHSAVKSLAGWIKKIFSKNENRSFFKSSVREWKNLIRKIKISKKCDLANFLRYEPLFLCAHKPVSKQEVCEQAILLLDKISSKWKTDRIEFTKVAIIEYVNKFYSEYEKQLRGNITPNEQKELTHFVISISYDDHSTHNDNSVNTTNVYNIEKVVMSGKNISESPTLEEEFKQDEEIINKLDNIYDIVYSCYENNGCQSALSELEKQDIHIQNLIDRLGNERLKARERSALQKHYGDYLYELGSYKTSLKAYKDALNFIEGKISSNDSRFGYLYYSIAFCYRDLSTNKSSEKENDKAIEFFAKALHIYKKSIGNNTEEVEANLNTICSNLQYLSDLVKDEIKEIIEKWNSLPHKVDEYIHSNSLQEQQELKSEIEAAYQYTNHTEPFEIWFENQIKSRSAAV